ncbi:MAG: GntR family transcriptional regulator [Firmicutes bacterium]|nr:GntR family transcriptional regulator [Bacillota bacterium]
MRPTARALLDIFKQWNPETRVPSEKELARRLKVSRADVVQAFKELAECDVITRVQKRGTFVNPQNQWKVPGAETGPITGIGLMGLIVPCLDTAFDRRLVSGFLRGARENGADVIIRLSENSPSQETEAFRDLANGKCAGIAVFPCENELLNEEIVTYHLRHYPIVLIDRWFPGFSFHCVRSDHYQGGVLAATHLLQGGCHRIGIVARDYQEPDGTVAVRERIRGIEDALLAVNELPQRNAYCFGRFATHEAFVDRISEKIIQDRSLDGVVTIRASDAQAFYEAWSAHGSRSLGWVTFDSWYDYPALFSSFSLGIDWMDTLPWVDQSEWEIGRRAAGVLAKVIGDPRVHIEEILPVKLQTAKSAPSTATV